MISDINNSLEGVWFILVCLYYIHKEISSGRNGQSWCQWDCSDYPKSAYLRKPSRLHSFWKYFHISFFGEQQLIVLEVSTLRISCSLMLQSRWRSDIKQYPFTITKYSHGDSPGVCEQAFWVFGSWKLRRDELWTVYSRQIYLKFRRHQNNIKSQD